MNQHNPLEKYYRQAKVFVKLPSADTHFIPEGTVVYENDKKEIGVRPLTASDEVMLKNPDALLNGEAINEIIKSCVPAVKQPSALLINDINFLMAVIKKVSEEEHDTAIVCPECKFENEFAVNLDYMIGSVEYLENTYPVNLTNGLTVFVRPYTYELSLKETAIAFEQAKFLKVLESETFDDELDRQKLKQLSNIIKTVSDLNVNLVIESIINVVNEADDINVSDTKLIKDFMKNISSHDAKLISTEVSRICNLGLAQNLDVECKQCQHKWKASIGFDPSTFFTDSL